MAYNPAEVHDAFDAAKQYARIRRRDAADSYLTGQDENEADSIRLRQITNIGSAVLNDGKIVSGAAITLNSTTGACTVAAGKVAAFGLVREPVGASLTVPTTGQLSAGLWIETRIVDETGDAALIFNPPGTSFPASGSPMSPREQQLARWGLSTETHTDTATVTYRYVAVHRIKDGVVIVDQPTRGAWADDLERYDRDAHGSYSVTGMQVVALGKTGSDQIFAVSPGTINAYGRKIDRPYDLRPAQTEAPPIRAVQGERATYVDASGSCIITAKNGPIASVQRVEVLKERTVALTKGLVNTMDALPDTAVSAIVSVVQGGTTYVATTDYVLSSDKVSWAPGGAEPAPGSTYNVTYRYYAVVTASAVGVDTITVAGAVNGSQVTLDYSYKVRRIDALSIEPTGDLVYIPGPVNHLNPVAPAVTGSGLVLAYIDNDWRGTPKVDNVAAPAVSFAEVKAMRESLTDLRAQVSRLSLQVALGSDQVSTRDRQFVDAMSDDNQRDLGIAQTAATAGGMLRLPIAVSVQHLPLTGPICPSFAHSRARTREAADGAISLLQSAADVPVYMSVAEAEDPRYNVAEVVSYETLLLARSVTGPDGKQPAPNYRTQTTKSHGQTLTVTVRGLTPGATLTTFKVSEVAVAPGGAPTADGNGVSTFTFAVPAGGQIGARYLYAEYSDGSRAQHIWQYGDAPNKGAVIMGIPAMVGSVSRIQIQIDEISGTQPIHWWLAHGGQAEAPYYAELGTKFVASGVIPVTGLSAGDWVTIPVPPLLGRYAQMGGPYAALLSFGSRGPHKLRTCAADDTRLKGQEQRTLAHRIDTAVMTTGYQTVELGTVAVAGITDFALRAYWGVVDPNDRGLPAVWQPALKIEYGAETVYVGPDYGSIPFAAPYTGNIKISAVLQVGNRIAGDPREPNYNYVTPRVQILTGVIGAAGTYVSQAMQPVTNLTVSAFLTALKDPDATLTVDVQDSGGAWVSMPQVSTTPLGNGWYDLRFTKAAITSTAPRLRVTIGGDVAKRIYVDNLRAASY